MKVIFIVFWLLHSISFGDTLEEVLQRHIRQTVDNPTRENVMKLAQEIRGNIWYKSLLTPEALRLTDQARAAVCKIPGHAQYFADEVKRRQEEVWGNPLVAGGRTSYNSDRGLYFGVIAHLPSPEAIKVLGKFLSDDKDTPSERISPNSDYGPNAPANSLYSTYTLVDIGLRDAPVSPKERYDDQGRILVKTRGWWKEIESGRKTFSFKGQNVEYRFKPDGTCETLAMANPPDDGPGRPQAGQTRPTHRQASDQRKPREAVELTIVPWLLVFAALVLAAGGWWAMRVSKTR